MRISGTEPSSVIFSQTKLFQILKSVVRLRSNNDYTLGQGVASIGVNVWYPFHGTVYICILYPNCRPEIQVA